MADEPTATNTTPPAPAPAPQATAPAPQGQPAGQPPLATATAPQTAQPVTQGQTGVAPAPATDKPPASEVELRADALEWQRRAETFEASEAKLKKELADLKAAQTASSDQSSARVTELMLENGKLRKMLDVHTGGRMNIDSSLRFVDGDVKVGADGKLEGEFEYRALGASPNESIVRQERQQTPQQMPAPAGIGLAANYATEGRHTVPGVSRTVNTV